jgi:hypothetical protein
MMVDADPCLAQALRDPSSSAIAGDVDEFIAAACRHRVLLLLGWRLRELSGLDRWPAAFVDGFLHAERQAIAVDCVRHNELAMVLAELAAAHARVLLFKGAAVAYTHYPAPHVRVRADTDLLIAFSDLAPFERVMSRLAYTRPPENSGSLVSYQNHYQKTDGYGVTHAFDVHWKISNLQSLAERLLVAELWDRRVSIPALGPGAFTVDTASALLLALIHRAGHHPGSKNLLWLYDFHVLASGLSSGQQDHVVDVALDRGLARLAADGLSVARDCFGGVALDGLIATLQAMRWRDDHVPAIEERLTQAAVLRLDLEALPNWRTRGRLIREHLLPPAGYMRTRYGVRSNALLPGLYLWRVLHGMPKWFRHQKAD